MIPFWKIPVLLNIFSEIFRSERFRSERFRSAKKSIMIDSILKGSIDMLQLKMLNPVTTIPQRPIEWTCNAFSFLNIFNLRLKHSTSHISCSISLLIAPGLRNIQGFFSLFIANSQYENTVKEDQVETYSTKDYSFTQGISSNTKHDKSNIIKRTYMDEKQPPIISEAWNTKSYCVVLHCIVVWSVFDIIN
jgi:hypothetical protein